jgi:hypothetical protein
MNPFGDNQERIVYFAETDARGKKIRFGIKAKDRSKHMYVIGKTGMGKSTLLENMAIQDIQNGEGMAFVDPHGSTAEKLLDYIPEERIKDVLYFAPFDMEYPIAFNVMEDVGYDKRHLVVSGLMSAFKKIWVDAWSGRMEYILSNTLLALLEYPDSTLLDVNRMYTNKAFRNRVVENITDPLVKSFWAEEFAGYTDRYTQEATPAIQNKIGQFTSNPVIRNIIGQPNSTFDFREMMDGRKIFIANLSKGRVGETNADLLGSMLTTKIYLAAMSRADLPAQGLAKLPSFYFYVDEFQSIANDSFADILSEARKYKLNLTIAHQYIEQMEENVRNAVFGNVGTTIAFRVGPFDAEVLETVFKPQFTASDLVNLSFAQIYLTLMIDGVGSRPFSATTLAPIEPPRLSYRDQILSFSRKTYGRERGAIEGGIAKQSRDLTAEAKAPSAPASKASTASRDARRGAKPESRKIENRGPAFSEKRQERKSPLSSDATLKDLVSGTQKERRENDVPQKTVIPATGSEKHLNDLRGALSKIARQSGRGDENPERASKKQISGRAPQRAPQPIRAPARKISTKDAQKGGQQTHRETPPQAEHEVPETVLRDLLDIEKE